MNKPDNNNFDDLLKSYWIHSTKETDYPRLSKDIKVDVAIIGGGIAGITTAFLLKKQGLSVALLDANKIALGTSGHTTAKITSQHHLIYNNIINSMGKERALQYAEANEKAIDFIEKTIKEYNIDCDFRRLPAYIYTEDASFIEKIQKEADVALELGLKAKYLTKLPLPISVKAAMVFEEQAEFHPRKYLLSLAEKIPGNRSYIYENTRIIDIENRSPCVLTSESGNKIISSQVIIASHFPCWDNAGLYFSRLKPDMSYVLGAKIKENFPNAMFINAEEPGRSLRAQNSKEGQLLLIGGDGHKIAHGESSLFHYENLNTFTRKLFNVEKLMYKWCTEDYITLDLVPYIGHLTSKTENIYVATGFGKWGMTNGTAAAIILKDLITKDDSPWKDVFNPSRTNSGNAVKNFLVEGFDVAKELIKGKAQKLPSCIEINENEGKIVEIDGGKYGAYKDSKETLHIVDITCPHMGCELKWNDIEKSWDCPCHGSRFTYDGDIIEGPAVHPLNHLHDGPNKPDANIF